MATKKTVTTGAKKRKPMTVEYARRAMARRVFNTFGDRIAGRASREVPLIEAQAIIDDYPTEKKSRGAAIADWVAHYEGVTYLEHEAAS